MPVWPIVGIVAVVLAVAGAIRYLVRVPPNGDGTDPERFLKDGTRHLPRNDSSPFV
jgi:hypothetical protein